MSLKPLERTILEHLVEVKAHRMTNIQQWLLELGEDQRDIAGALKGLVEKGFIQVQPDPEYMYLGTPRPKSIGHGPHEAGDQELKDTRITALFHAKGEEALQPAAPAAPAKEVWYKRWQGIVALIVALLGLPLAVFKLGDELGWRKSRLDGRVVIIGSGASAGANVVVHLDGDIKDKQPTAPDGSFTFPVPRGNQHVSVWADAGPARGSGVLKLILKGDTSIVLELPPAGIPHQDRSLNVRVKASTPALFVDGSPEVFVNDTFGVTQRDPRRTDPQGDVTFRLPDSLVSYKVWAEHSGFLPSDIAWVPLHRDTSIRLTLGVVPPSPPRALGMGPQPEPDTLWMNDVATGAYAVRYWIEGGQGADFQKILQRRDTLRVYGFTGNVGIFPSEETQELMLYGFWTEGQAQAMQRKVIALNNKVRGTQNSLIAVVDLRERCAARHLFLDQAGQWQCNKPGTPPPGPVIAGVFPSSDVITDVKESGTARGTKSKEAWFKEGYYLLFGEFKVVLLDLKEGSIRARVEHLRSDGSAEMIRPDVAIALHGHFSFGWQGKECRINLENIARAGKNPLKKAAFITFETLN